MQTVALNCMEWVLPHCISRPIYRWIGSNVGFTIITDHRSNDLSSYRPWWSWDEFTHKARVDPVIEVFRENERSPVARLSPSVVPTLEQQIAENHWRGTWRCINCTLFVYRVCVSCCRYYFTTRWQHITSEPFCTWHAGTSGAYRRFHL